MAKRRIDVDIVANDNASSVFNNVRNTASSMSSSLMGALSGTVGAVGKIDSALRTYNASMYRFNRVVGSVVKTAGDSIYNFTKDAINNFSELEQQHAKTMGAMATEYGKTAKEQQRFLNDSEKLKQQALRLGTVGPNGKGSLNTVYDVSYAQTALVKSGMSADDILNSSAVESILKFAGGNDLDIDTATTFAVNLATVFNKPVEEWGKMLDMVTKAADISVIDVEDIMDSLTYTGGIASGLGRPLEEVLGVISVMGQAGLRGRVAGTGLQAFFTRILSAGELGDTAIGNAPSEYVGNMYNAFIAEAVNPDGSFKDMDDVAELLDLAMSELNDQEQAWFAKKLFGLYQMKAAYALTGSVEGDENLITDFIDQIENQSEGTNDIKYELMQGSQYGKIQSLKNAWEGTKTDFGDRLSPVVSAVSDEMFRFLNDPQNYRINWDSLRQAFAESGDLIGEKYGQELGQAVEDLGNFGIDSAIITEAMLPYVGGLVSGIGKLFRGDISGALDDFSRGLEDTNENIDDLPSELRNSAQAARNVIVAFTNLAGLNIATQIAQLISSALNIFIAKPIKWITGKIASTSTTVSSPNAVLNANYVQTNSATATVDIGSVPLMNVTATVVNVFGGGTGTPTTPTTPTLPSAPTTPTLPSAPTTPTLPSGGGGTILLPGAGGLFGLPGSTTPALPGSTTPALPGSTIGGNPLDIKMYKFGGTYMTAKDIFAKLKGAAVKGLSIAAILAFADASLSPGVFESKDKRVEEGNNWLDRYVAEGSDPKLNNYTMAWAQAHPDYDVNTYGYNNNEAINNILMNEYAGRTAARDEMMEFYRSNDGVSLLKELFAQQIEEEGKITEDFLSSLLTWDKDGYRYTGSQLDIKELLEYIYGGGSVGYYYDEPSSYMGRFADMSVDDFIKLMMDIASNRESNNDDTGSNGNRWYDNYDGSYSDTPNNYENWNTNPDGSISPPVYTPPKEEDVIPDINDYLYPNGVRPMSFEPNININVNVDKGGNVVTTVDMNGASRVIARRASQYGQTYMSI